MPIDTILAPSQLNADPAKYHGSTVIVRGALYYGPEVHVIYESKDLHDEMKRRWDASDPAFDPNDYDKYCLTITNPDRLKIRGRSLDGKEIVIQGRFRMDYLDGNTVDFGACSNPTGIVIDKIRWSR